MYELLCAILGGVALILGAVINKTHKGATIAFCLIGFLLLSIAALMFANGLEKDVPSSENSGNGETIEEETLPPSPPTAEPASPTPTPSDDIVTLLGVELPSYPCEEVVDEYGPELHYPEESEYLDDYQIRYIDAPKGHSIYSYSSHRSEKKQLKITILQDEAVILLANNVNNGMSCIIVPEEKAAVWVNSDYLSTSPG